jgi:multidrug efflux system outer membrane protein
MHRPMALFLRSPALRCDMRPAGRVWHRASKPLQTAAMMAMVAMAGCSGLSPETAIPRAGPGDAAASAEPPAAATVWWSAFGDARLDDLITDALAQNLDIRAALTRIDEATAAAGAAGARLLPAVTAEGSAGRADQSTAGPASKRTAVLEASWTIDLFGSVRAAREAAVARLKETRFSEQATRLLTSGAVAEAYVELRFYQDSLELNRLSLASIRKTRALIAAAQDEGAASRLDLLQIEQLLASAEAEIPGLMAGRTAALLRLARLVNQPVGTISVRIGDSHIPVPKLMLPDGIAVEVIRNRPDVLAAEQALLAAAADAGVAKADLYPSLALTGNITAISIGGARAPETWSFGPTIRLPLFSGGALHAKLRGAEARAERARLEWQASVLGATEEAGAALTAIARSGESVAAHTHVVTLSDEVLKLGRDSYELGETDLLALLDAERSLLDARIASAAAQRERALAFIRLSIATAGRLAEAQE